MGDRTVYGNQFSENGWRMVDQASCVWVTIPGTAVTLQIREGQPAAIMGAFAADFNAYVEPLRDPDSACWTATNSVASSNHLSGTAMDLNWNSHPFRVEDAGFDGAKLGAVREMLAFYEKMIFWGNDWTDPKDAMHFQMGYDTYGSGNVARVQDFINRKIRPDGFSTFRRGGTAGPAPQQNTDAVTVLAQAMGGTLPTARYAALLPALSESLRDSRCGTVDRIAMWLAQIGHESAGLRYMEEIASGAAYEGRADLGNTQRGDGVRFKGRGPIQVTGRSNYTRLSQWAFGQGLVPSATFFVDQPDQLASDQYGFVGVTWYWTIARNMNSYADHADILGATRAVNGGTNGLQDRTERWNRCRAMGNQLLTLAISPAPAPQDELEEILMLAVPSMSIYANPGEPDVPIPVMIAAQDAHGPHEPYVEGRARKGYADDLLRVARTAAGKGKAPYGTTPEAIAQATDVINEIQAAHPEYIQAAKAALAQKGV